MSETEVITAEGGIVTGRTLKIRTMKGNVKWYDSVKGYGFIQTEDNKDIFVHRTGLEDSAKTLEAGEPVEFEIEEREKGPVAVNVRKAK